MGSHGLIEVDVKNDVLSSDAPNPSRRSFLKASLATTALSAVSFPDEPPKPHGRMPSIPTVSDLAGGHFTHRMRDLCSNQTTHNELGYVQATKSVSGITALALPPFGCCGVPETPWSPGFLLTCELFLNGRVLL